MEIFFSELALYPITLVPVLLHLWSDEVEWMRDRGSSIGSVTFGGSIPVRQLVRHMIFCLENLRMDLFKGRDLGVPFQKCRDSTGATVYFAIKLPDRIDHFGVVCINKMGATICMAGKMALDHTVKRKMPQIFQRIK